MAARKTTPPPLSPMCPDCRALAAKVARLERQQRQQAANARKYEALLLQLRADLAEARELGRKLEDSLSYHRFTQPYLLHLFGQHLPQQNALAAALFHLN